MVTKRKLCMASGGVLPKTSDDAPKDKKPAGWKEGLVAALRAIKGEGEGRKTEGSPAPTIENARNAIVDRKAANRSVLNYARGGVLPVIGIGSGTSDSISAVVDGQKVGLSNGEGFATLPAKTMKTPGAVGAIESIIQATNDGKPPVPTKDGGRAQGGVDDPKKTDPNKFPYTGKPAPTAQQVYAGAGKGIGDAIATHAFPSTAGAVQKYGDAAQAAAGAGNYGGAIGQVVRGGVAGTIGLVDDTMRSAAHVLDPAASALKTLVTGDNTPASAAPTAPTAPAQQTPVTSAMADRAVGVPEIPAPQAPSAQTPAAAAPRIQSFDAGTEGADRVRNLIADRGFVPNRGQGLITSSSGGATVLNTPAAEATAPETVTLDALVQERARRALAGDVAGAHALNGSIASMQAANTAGVLVEKGRGEVADSAAARIAREGLGAAYDSGDQEAVNKATLKAIAAGVLSPPRNNSPYEIKTDPLGNQTRLNSSTGMSETLDRATNTWKPIGSAAEVPEFASESDVRSAQKAGKLKVGQKVMVGGRMATVTAD